MTLARAFVEDWISTRISVEAFIDDEVDDARLKSLADQCLAAAEGNGINSLDVYRVYPNLSAKISEAISAAVDAEVSRLISEGARLGQASFHLPDDGRDDKGKGKKFIGTLTKSYCRL